MDYAVNIIKNGIIRISKYKNMPENYLERYGIINLPTQEQTENITVSDNKIILPGNKVIEFGVRGDYDNEFWQNEICYELKKFADKTPDRINIEGRPQEGFEQFSDDSRVDESLKKFGISFKISQDEKFYGLGEAGRDRVQLRGDSYQNWAVYQFDEIPIPLVVCSGNWGLFICAEDRHFVDIDDCAKNRLTVLGNSDELDVFLLYGSSMKDIIRLYTDISGKSMLLPKWAYGLTYIAPIFANQHEILSDMMKFREKHIPCDNVSLEPGWMKKHYDYSFSKDWDVEKFHIEIWMRKRENKQSFLTVMRRFGFHVALWFCMNYDLCDHEEKKITGIENIPSWYEHIKRFVDAGVDGFKIDPSDMVMRINPDKIYTNGQSELKMHNISQALVMKQMKEGFEEQTNRRPFLHYCGGYTGQQRWGAGTTGDNGGLSGSMIWLQNLAMSGFMNCTVDMDIHNAAGIHFGMFAPWAHHNAWAGCDQPWYAGAQLEEIYIYYARLRYSIIPYIYSLALECHETGIPMIRPMALEFQTDNECSDILYEYMIGEYILLSAFTDEVYLPEGKWIDFWTDKEYDGRQKIRYSPPENRGGGFFIKKGAVIPKWCGRDYVKQYSDDVIELHFYPCGKTEYVFREDDGESLDYMNSRSCHTHITCVEEGDNVIINIGHRSGEYMGKTKNRLWDIHLHGTSKNASVLCDNDEWKITCSK